MTRTAWPPSGRLSGTTGPAGHPPPRSRPCHRDRGGGPVEAALVLPLLLILVFGVVHIAMYHLARQAALSAAQVALTAQQGFHAAPDSGQERAERYLRQVPPVLRDPVIDVRSDDQVVEVTVAGTAISVIPGYRPTVTQTARGPVERVTSP